MLLRLTLDQFVIVETAALEFVPGLNVLTGETGAGKSILIDALGFLCGGHASSEWLRRGAERMTVEGALDLRADSGRDRAGIPGASLVETVESFGVPLDPDGLLLLRREMGPDGRSRCFANGRQILVSQLRTLTSGAVWIVGQGEQRALTASPEQEWLLDRYAHSLDRRRLYRELRRRFLEVRASLETMEAEREAFRREEEWLRFQAREISEAEVQPGERDRIEERRRAARARVEDQAFLGEVVSRLFEDEGSVLDHLESLAHRVHQAEGERWREIERAIAALRESVRELRKLVPSMEEVELEDPEDVEERARHLGRLCRKYGGDEQSVLAHLEEVESRIETGERLAGDMEASSSAMEVLRSEVGAAGAMLSRLREESAQAFAEAAGVELQALGMAGAALTFLFRRESDPEGVPLPEGADPGSGLRRVRPLEGGLERVSLQFRSHPSEPSGELGKIASGGELSRILLAIHAALGENGPPGCWVLDEVDQGIGGETARRVGERLAIMARHAQVLLVTHLPAIAAQADRHFRVVKEEVRGRPSARVEGVAGEDRLGELARMLSGDAGSSIARKHARELLGGTRGNRGQGA